MNYSRSDAKAYARKHLSGIWAAAQTPFNADLSIDEAGLRRSVQSALEAAIYSQDVIDAVIVDPAGTVIASSDPVQVGKTIEPRPPLNNLIAERGLDLAELAAEVLRNGKNRIDGATVRAAIGARPAVPNAPPPAVAPALVAPAPAPALPPGRPGDVITLNTMRQRTGERLS